MKHIKMCIRRENKFNPMIHKWDLELFLKRYGITPFLMYSMLKNDPIIKTVKYGDVVKFERRKLSIKVKPTSQ